MRKRHPKQKDSSEASCSQEIDKDVVVVEEEPEADVRRSGKAMFSVLVLITYLCCAVYNFQHANLPQPLTAKQAGKRGFSEIEAMKHVQALTEFGPHPVSSDALLHALEYVLASIEKVKETAHWEVDVNVDFFESKSGVNRLVGGFFKGKSLVYSDISHIVVRILPKYESEAGDNAILVSSHIDTVFSTGGAGDCSSCVAVMLELARSVSQSAHGFKNSIIFLFNTGEEEGLNGAHSFITQHPWSSTVRLAIDLEAMGTGGKSAVFQAGPNPWAIENFALAAKYPSGHIIGQDLFASGLIKSATDFQVYKEVAGLSGLDFAFTDNTAVYHTKNDKMELIKPGSLQHLGENMLAFLLRVASSSDLPNDKSPQGVEKSNPDSAVYFDILGKYMIVYRQSFATMLYVSVIMQSLLIWVMSLVMGGRVAVVSLILSCLSIILAWIFSVAFSVAVAFILPWISSSPVPYASNPLMAVGLFLSPAVLGSISGQHVAFTLLWKQSLKGNSKKRQVSLRLQHYLAKLEAERWLFKAGFIQWLVLLALGTFYKLGSTYLALVWLVPPVFAYGLLEATLTPIRLPKPLKLATLLLSLALPVLVSSGSFVRLTGTLIGMLIRFDSNPGGTADWLGNAMVAAVIATFVSLTMVYLLAYIHLSGAKRSIVTALCITTFLSLVLVSSGVFPSFTEDTARAVHVVHVVDTTGEDHVSFISLFSYTPGNLNVEAAQLKDEGFRCGREDKVDFVSFEATYSCMTNKDAKVGWDKRDIPVLRVIEDQARDERRVKVVSMETGGSTRWTLGIDMEQVENFTLKVGGEEDEEVMIERGDKSSNAEGWHQVQFSGGKKAPTSFVLELYEKKGGVSCEKKERPVLKLRTDFSRITPQVQRVLERLPPFCSLFGKSTSPFTLAFIASLPCIK